MALRLIGSQLLCHVKVTTEFRLQERPDTLVIGRFSGKHAVIEIRSGTSVYFNKIDPAVYFVGERCLALQLAMAKIAIDLNLLEALVSHGRSMSVQELAQATEAQDVLFGRILRYLAA
ncbi:hypothetical protein BDV37DRAFT_278874 [Aspergillus pseudonomiae]|uniref:O-methyltransferase dimerisation domain-containing protein n=1 Tax=Aspergillus pseudonomiae TaxID=1506151 RepID=A0A5N7DQQ9_9EURO|nr:uncharacterized protein BDV37DRAFT_278874 [Aspergillus pseudonomiae]KAE8408383.1 hypothetical protein BDV37DRAFT_278874 [Aspergillus pseudonomiae]